MSSQDSSAGWSGVVSIAVSCIGGTEVEVEGPSAFESEGGWAGGLADDMVENAK